MTKREVIDRMARAGMVEDIVMNISGCSRLTPMLKDLAQDIYCIVMDYDAKKVVRMWESGAMPFFIVRVAINQYNSSRSPFYYKYRKFSALTTCIEDYADNV